LTASYRAAVPADRAFIVSGWSSSYRLSRDISFIQMADYAKHMHAIVESVLARPRCEVIVAHGEVLRGFIAFERPDFVHYVYVAQPYRRNGHARGLFEAADIDPLSRFAFAARTKTSWELRGKVPAAQFDPFRARFAQKETT